MTFLSLHFPASVFREQPGLWGAKGTEYFSLALQKLGPKKRKKAHLSPLVADATTGAIILPGLQQDLAAAQQCCSLTAVTQTSHTGVRGCVPTPAPENVRERVSLHVCAYASGKPGSAHVGMGQWDYERGHRTVSMYWRVARPSMCQRARGTRTYSQVHPWGT